MIDLDNLPKSPGCYFFKSKTGIILYIGKAKVLSNRVKSYFSGKHDSKTNALVQHIDSVDFIVTSSEVEALLLENNLIKKHKPKYNIDLKDSKSYAYLRLTNEEFPRLRIARNKIEKGTYFGPFVSGAARNYILQTLIRTFKIRTCNKLPKRSCLRFHLGLCSAPCIKNISKYDYKQNVESAVKILQGKTTELKKSLKEKMKIASEKNHFEKAIEYRNQIESINSLKEKQNMERQMSYNQDIIHFKETSDQVVVMLFHVHKGTLDGKQEFIFKPTPDFFEEFIIQYYADNPIPKELVVSHKLSESVNEYLNKIRKKKTIITIPKVGPKKLLLDLALRNIELAHFNEEEKLLELQNKLRLQSKPVVIECFDISHFGGTATVGSMVQFRNGKPDKSNYRRFKIKTVQGIDDFASIAEVVKRRYTRLVKEQADLPDLIVIDGGKGQLSVARTAIQESGVKIPIISIAKREEEIYVPGRKIPYKLDKRNKGLQLVQQIRDEAHRFAITYNRLLRKKAILK